MLSPGPGSGRRRAGMFLIPFRFPFPPRIDAEDYCVGLQRLTVPHCDAQERIADLSVGWLPSAVFPSHGPSGTSSIRCLVMLAGSFSGEPVQANRAGCNQLLHDVRLRWVIWPTRVRRDMPANSIVFSARNASCGVNPLLAAQGEPGHTQISA